MTGFTVGAGADCGARPDIAVPAQRHPSPAEDAGHTGARDSARYFRPAGLAGVQALRASYTTHRFSPHLHQGWTLALIDAGCATIDLAGIRHEACPGAVVLIPPEVVHTGQPAGPSGYRYRAAYLDATTSAGWLPEQLRSRPCHDALPAVTSNRRLATTLSRLHCSLALPGRELERGEALTALAGELTALVLGQPDRNVGPPPMGVARALDYVRTHWREDFTMSDLAKAAGLSMFHLIRVFHQHTGATPAVYRRALRVRAAQRLLEGGMPPAEAAVRCGFCDQSHLIRHFKAAIGVTPRQYVRGES